MSGHIIQNMQGLFDATTKSLRGFIDGKGAEVGSMPYLFAQSAVPIIVPSSGTSDAVGGITFTTALSFQPGVACSIWLPNGVVTAGSAGTGARLYPVVFSSTTVCQIQGTGIVTANGAYTQSITGLTIVSMTIPGGSMGNNGSQRINYSMSYNNSAGTKQMTLIRGGLWTHQIIGSTTQWAEAIVSTKNRGVQNRQLNSKTGSPGTVIGQNSSTDLYTSVDTSVDHALNFAAQLNTATDYIILEGYSVETLPMF